MKPMIQLDRVTKHFPEHRSRVSTFSKIKEIVTGTADKTHNPFVALTDINIEILPAEKVALIGDNGAGKTTLLKLIAGLYQPTQGTVKVFGERVLVAGLGIGMMDELSLMENIVLYGMIYGLDREEIYRLMPEILEWAELKEFYGAKLKQLSSGMKARLAFSTMRYFRKEIYLLDEVLAAGDRHFKEKCKEVFDAYRSSESTFVVATHDLNFVGDFCDKALWLHKGRQMAFGFPSEIVEMYKSTDHKSLTPASEIGIIHVS
jgi:ABC-type polysaccharide/polyol phosphate transport system ATPase subunit